MDAELREAAAAADALRVALGDAGDQFDANQVVADLNRMGVSFDEIRADADKFAATLREVDDIRVRQINDGLDDIGEQTGRGRRQRRPSPLSVGQHGRQRRPGHFRAEQFARCRHRTGGRLRQIAEYATEGNIR